MSATAIIIDKETGANISEIVPGIWRIENPKPAGGPFPKGFSFISFLLVDEHSLLWQTGYKHLYPHVKAAVDRILADRGGMTALKYVSFSHVEADECGSLDFVLKDAPDATVLHGGTGVLVSLQDLTCGRCKSMTDRETLSLGKKFTISWQDAAHVPHGWETGYIFEESTKTLLGGDLFSQGGNQFPITNDLDVFMGGVLKNFGEWSFHPQTQNILGKLADLNPSVITSMHGTSFRGDGKAAIGRLSALVAEMQKFAEDKVKGNQ